MPSAGNKPRRRRWHPSLDESDESDPLAALVDRIFETPKGRDIAHQVLATPQAKGLFSKLQAALDRAGNAIDPTSVRRPPPRPPAQHPGRSAHVPPRPQPTDAHKRAHNLRAARSIMHFGPSEPLTKERITKQRRALAAICHPDKGGSNEAMQKLNRAADLLLASAK